MQIKGRAEGDHDMRGIRSTVTAPRVEPNASFVSVSSCMSHDW